MPFESEVFVSYSSDDRDWAKRLSDSLLTTELKLSTFFDQQSLRVGEDWEQAIGRSLERSRHMVVLWSDHAKNSDWVSREWASFLQRAKPDKDPHRRLIFINLQGSNRAFSKFQQLNSAELQAAYAGGQPASQAVWDEMLALLRAGLDPNSRPLAIPLAVLTLTRPELDALEDKRWNWIESDLRISRKRLQDRYGAAREDWKPFSTNESIATVLARARADVTKAYPGRVARWKAPDASFWEDIVAAQRFVEEEFNSGELSLLVIDPVAICHPDVFQRLTLFQKSLDRECNVVIALPPFGLPRRIAGLRQTLLVRGAPWFNDYFNPVLSTPHIVRARCGLMISDGDDIRRELLAAAAASTAASKVKSRSKYLQHGRGQ